MPLLAAGAVLLGTGLDILPPDPLVLNLTLSRGLILVGLLALVAGGARLRHFRTPLDPAVGLLLLAAVATTVRGGHPGAPLRFLLTAVAFFYLTVALCRRRRAAREALAVVALVAVVASAGAGVAQVAQGTPTTYYRDGFTPLVSFKPRDDLVTRAVGSFPNPNLMAGHVLLLAPLALLTVLAAGTREARAVALALVALGYLGLVLSYSRSALGAALAAAGVAAYALRPAWRRGLAVAGGVVAVLLVVGTVLTDGRLVGAFGRPEAWRLAVEAAGTSPLLGVGLARAGDVMNALGGPDTPFLHAHNLWLTWWVEAGPLALLAVLLITVWLLVRAYRDAAAGSPWGAGGLAALAGFCLFSLFDHPANAERVALAFWFVAAIVASGVPVRLGGHEQRQGRDRPARRRAGARAA